jgi:hypothetical protein
MNVSTNKKKKVLFFIKGSMPTKENFSEAQKIETEKSYCVVFRNYHFVSEDEKPEHCDFVCGTVPKSYSEFNKISEDETEEQNNNVKGKGKGKEKENVSDGWTNN